MSNYILTPDGRLYHYDSSELYHYGVPGMKWGQRKQRVQVSGGGRLGRGSQASASSTSAKVARDKKKSRVKKGIAIGAAVAGTALVAFGAYKLNKAINNKAWQKATEIGNAKANQIFSAEGRAKSWAESHGGIYKSATLDRMRTDSHGIRRDEISKVYSSMSYGDKVKNYVNDIRRR